LRIDRKCQSISHVATFIYLNLLNRSIELLCINFDIDREIGWQTILSQYRMDLGVMFAGFTQYLYHRAKRTVSAFRPVFDFNEYDISLFGIAHFIFWYENISVHFWIRSRYKTKILLDINDAHKFSFFAFDHFYNLAFWFLA